MLLGPGLEHLRHPPSPTQPPTGLRTTLLWARVGGVGLGRTPIPASSPWNTSVPCQGTAQSLQHLLSPSPFWHGPKSQQCLWMCHCFPVDTWESDRPGARQGLPPLWILGRQGQLRSLLAAGKGRGQPGPPGWGARSITHHWLCLSAVGGC